MKRPTLANWNGAILPLEEVRVSVLDRGFMFGDAVYEALRVYSGRAWLLDEHCARLRSSLAELRIDADVNRVRQRMLETLRASGVREGLIYVQVTRGAAPRHHAFPRPEPAPNELVYVEDYGGDPFADIRPHGVGVITFPDVRWERRDIKSTNLLANCLAAQKAAEAGCFEAVLVEADGRISEASRNSVFAVKEGKVWTRPTSHHILPGITRRLVLELAERAGIPTVERGVGQGDLSTIDELFLTGTTSEVLGVTHVDARPVGDGRVGPITRRLADTYRQSVQDWLVGTSE